MHVNRIRINQDMYQTVTTVNGQNIKRLLHHSNLYVMYSKLLKLKRSKWTGMLRTSEPHVTDSSLLWRIKSFWPISWLLHTYVQDIKTTMTHCWHWNKFYHLIHEPFSHTWLLLAGKQLQSFFQYKWNGFTSRFNVFVWCWFKNKSPTHKIVALAFYNS